MQPHTAISGAHPRPIAPRPIASGPADSWVLDAGYIAFLLLIFVTLTPFASRDPMMVHHGEGDVLRQACYLTAFAAVVGTALWWRGFAVLRVVPLALALALLWDLFSASWSLQPDVTLRRAVLASVIVISAMVSVEALGRDRALSILRYLLIGILIVNWVSVFTVPQAVHLPDDPERDVVGAWRGLYYHKNIAGAVTAISAMIFLFDALKRKRLIDWALVIAAVVFLIMTESKTSIGLLVLSLLAAAFYRLVGHRGLDRMIGWTAAAMIAVIGGGFIWAYWDTIVQMFQDPMEFTGRAAIWQAEAAYIHDHPLLGAGFGSFADTGARSPLWGYMSEEWIGAISHGHCGYLQLAVTTGLIGTVLTLAGTIVQPLMQFAARARAQTLFTTLLFAIFIFVALHNVMESDFLEGDAPQWVVFIMAIAMLRMEMREPPKAEARP